MKRFLCWLKFGHIWWKVGDIGQQETMYQCAHCALTEVFHNTTGARR